MTKITKHGIWIEKGDEIKLTNVHMYSSINPLAFLEFIGAEIHSLSESANHQRYEDKE